MIECFICKAKYHFGIIHFCPTGFYSYPVTYNQELKDYLNQPREGDDTDNPEDQNWSILGVEEEEDNIRKSKRKSIRYGGKYKGRHHGSKQKDA